MRTPAYHISLMLIIGISQAMAMEYSSSFGEVVTDIPHNVVIIISVILMTCIWLGCTYFMASRHQKAVHYLQRQLDELWLLQAKPSVWPHAPFIPNPREENPPEYIPPRNPQEQEQEAKETMERAQKAMAFLEARNNQKFGKNTSSCSTDC